jgi:hypothetical protein
MFAEVTEQSRLPRARPTCDKDIPACLLHYLQGSSELGIEIDGGHIGGKFAFIWGGTSVYFPCLPS